MKPSRDNPQRISERTQENLLAAIFLAVFLLAILVGLTTLTARALLVPLPVAVAGCVFTIAQLVVQNRRRGRDPTSGAATGQGPATESPLTKAQEDSETASGAVAGAVSEHATTNRAGGSPWMAILLVLAFLVIVLAIGMLPAITIYVAGYLTLIAKLRAHTTLLTTLMMIGGIYLLFVVVLEVRLWSGYLLGPLL